LRLQRGDSNTIATSVQHIVDDPGNRLSIEASEADRTVVTPVLEARSLSVSFGGVRALIDVDLQIEQGQLVGLIGPNGAGKTTFIDAIAGFVGYRGSVLLDGRDLGGKPAHARARLGLARTWQSIELFDDLTVRENVAVASDRLTPSLAVRELFSSGDSGMAEVDEALRIFELDGLGESMPSEVSQAHRKLVGVARALAASPRLLCLDEPAAGLDTLESAALGRHLREIVDRGTTMLLVDHDMGLVLSISDYVVVLEFGEVISEGTPEIVRSDPKVISAYLGEAGAEVADELGADAGAVT
jgi:branched-chain amino acid transport system ATP-binding protein